MLKDLSKSIILVVVQWCIANSATVWTPLWCQSGQAAPSELTIHAGLLEQAQPSSVFQKKIKIRTHRSIKETKANAKVKLGQSHSSVCRSVTPSSRSHNTAGVAAAQCFCGNDDYKPLTESWASSACHSMKCFGMKRSSKQLSQQL